jgi:hypothetical protein
VIELELPEPRFEELTLVNIDAQRGKGDPDDEALQPLRGRVLVDGPRGFRITAESLTADPDIGRFVGFDSAGYEFYFVHLAVSFRALGSPRVKSAEVRLALASVPDAPAPFALHMKPLGDGDKVSVRRTARFGPRLKLLDAVEAEIGSVEAEKSFERTELVVRGLGLDGASPLWEFTRTGASKLEGACRLELVVQAARGSAVSVSGVVTARAAGNIPWRYRGGLPRPLDFAAVL